MCVYLILFLHPSPNLDILLLLSSYKLSAHVIMFPTPPIIVVAVFYMWMNVNTWSQRNHVGRDFQPRWTFYCDSSCRDLFIVTHMVTLTFNECGSKLRVVIQKKKMLKEKKHLTSVIWEWQLAWQFRDMLLLL